ncbi:sulfotransferase family protein [Solicola gregarius]|uniref:Sulfotransferase n=1 Tax=Solicola gregarius TaxID=2908642 RepID=A0AA46YKU3_9ACTN|nr:sulfotransferase [Solicola gregarius]UYM04856.1 sulfotransferase [Solicola gregarius]
MSDRILVLITGTGRSGTSTMSGTLHHLGLSVPGPYLGANRSNPKGFFESMWAVQFHKRIHKRARVNDFDARLDALDRVREATTDESIAELDEWLAGQDAEQLVVKDPRTVWHQRLWADRAAQAGRSIRYVSMLRHPAEVIGSRVTYYLSRGNIDLSERAYTISNVGRWVSASLVNERETRGERRAFVRYADLLDDWRSVAGMLRDDLGLSYDTSLDPHTPHPVDDFVEPELRRVRVTWYDLDVPDELQAIAQATWDNLGLLADNAGAAEDASAALDVLAQRYDRLLDDSQALAYDAIYAAGAEGRAEGARTARRKLKERARERKRAREQAD